MHPHAPYITAGSGTNNATLADIPVNMHSPRSSDTGNDFECSNGVDANLLAALNSVDSPVDRNMGEYMQAKRRKVHAQYLAEPITVNLDDIVPRPGTDSSNDEASITESAASAVSDAVTADRNSRNTTDLFCGCVFWVDGHTNPPLSVLRPLITARGGLVDQTLLANAAGGNGNTITHIIAST